MNIFPDDNTLINYLKQILDNKNVSLISRQHSIRSSTFPAEIVRCKLNDKMISLQCKYLNGMNHNNYGHRGAVEYEAKIYREILSKINLPVAEYFGLIHLENNNLCLVIEFLENAELLFRSLEENQLEKSIKWIAEFHSAFQDNYPSDIPKYTSEYYLIWPDKVEKIVSGLDGRYPWIKNITGFFNRNINILTNAPLTLIHGEYYPNNILIHQGQIKPIDWESVAIAPGEIDLASSIDGHDEITKNNAIETYIKTRKLNSQEINQLNNVLLMAQLYFHFRWIGGKPNKVEKYADRFEHLQLLSKQAGCL